VLAPFPTKLKLSERYPSKFARADNLSVEGYLEESDEPTKGRIVKRGRICGWPFLYVYLHSRAAA
jgi:hypothetical protein